MHFQHIQKSQWTWKFTLFLTCADCIQSTANNSGNASTKKSNYVRYQWCWQQ